MEVIGLSILLLISCSGAHIIQDGQCDENIALQQDFDLEKVKLYSCLLYAFHCPFCYLHKLSDSKNIQKDAFVHTLIFSM